MNLTPEIVEKLRELKDINGLTNDQIAKRTDPPMTGAAVRRYMAGDVKDAPRDSIRKIIIALNGDPEEVFRKKEDPEIEAYYLRQKLKETKENCEKIVLNKDKWLMRLFVLSIALGLALLVVLAWAVKMNTILSF